MRGNTYVCRTCGKPFDYCPKCMITPAPYKEDGFCTFEHSQIFSILSRNGCNLATPEETLRALEPYDLSQEFAPSVEAHINSLIEAQPEPIEETEEAIG